MLIKYLQELDIERLSNELIENLDYITDEEITQLQNKALQIREQLRVWPLKATTSMPCYHKVESIQNMATYRSLEIQYPWFAGVTYEKNTLKVRVRS